MSVDYVNSGTYTYYRAIPFVHWYYVNSGTYTYYRAIPFVHWYHVLVVQQETSSHVVTHRCTSLAI